MILQQISKTGLGTRATQGMLDWKRDLLEELVDDELPRGIQSLSRISSSGSSQVSETSSSSSSSWSESFPGMSGFANLSGSTGPTGFSISSGIRTGFFFFKTLCFWTELGIATVSEELFKLLMMSTLMTSSPSSTPSSISFSNSVSSTLAELCSNFRFSLTFLKKFFFVLILYS